MPSWKSNLRIALRKNYPIYLATTKLMSMLGIPQRRYQAYQPDTEWQGRIDDVLACPDNSFFEHVQDAGQLQGPIQIMHNGIKIFAGSYYGLGGVTKMLELNKGVHEPQEEKAFDIVVQSLKKERPTMVEMGSFWSFYSMTLLQTHPKGRCFMIEPEYESMWCGINNFKLNGMKGDFTHAFIDEQSGTLDGTKVTNLDDFVKEKSIDYIDILHSDIQGFELKMLQGAQQTFKDKKVSYVFISTHSNELHYGCVDFLKAQGFSILASADMEETFSFDGLIVAKAPHVAGGIDKIEIALKVTK